jgi:hypothetical protein
MGCHQTCPQMRNCTSGNDGREKILLWVQSDSTCPVLVAKIFSFPSDPNHPHILRHPVPQRGGSRSSRTRGGMRWTQAAHLTRALPCGRRSRVVLTPRRWCQVLGKQASCKFLGGDGGKQARSPGRARRKPLKPLRGECRATRCDRGDELVCFLPLHMRLRAHRAPGIPCALCFSRRRNMHNSGVSRREMAEPYVELERLAFRGPCVTRHSGSFRPRFYCRPRCVAVATRSKRSKVRIASAS